jgi:hypothetical protein
MAAEALGDVERELHEATSRAATLVTSTSGRLFTVRPNPGSWSAAECLSHLSLSTQLFLPVLRKALDDAKQRGMSSRRSPKMDVLGRVLRWFLEPPTRIRSKTSAPFVPRSVRAKAEALNDFARLQEQLIDLLHEARDFDLQRMKIVSPFNTRIRYNVYSAFRIIAAHQRRHLWQAEQAVATLRGNTAHAA